MLEESAEGWQDKEADAESHEEACAGDARLCHGDGARGVLEEGECMCGILVTALGEALKASAMGGGECSLDLREVGIRREADEEQDECNEVG